MDRSHVLNVVLKHFRANVDLPDDFQVDPSRSMLEQGAQSLDLLEIVSGAMRELKIRVPRTSLRDLKNIDELVDVFYAQCLRDPSHSPENTVRAAGGAS
jgi:acyl carrier protein